MDYKRIYNYLRDSIGNRSENCLITISVSSNIRPLTTFYLICTKLEQKKVIMLVDGNNLARMFPLTKFTNHPTDFEKKLREILENWGYNYLINSEGSETTIYVRKIGVIL